MGVPDVNLKSLTDPAVYISLTMAILAFGLDRAHKAVAAPAHVDRGGGIQQGD